MSWVNCCRVCLNLVEDTTEILHTLLEPLSFKSDIKLAVSPVISDVKMDISGQLEKVKVSSLHCLMRDLLFSRFTLNQYYPVWVVLSPLGHLEDREEVEQKRIF